MSTKFVPGDLISVGPAWRMGPYKGHPGEYVADGGEGVWRVLAVVGNGADLKVTRDLDAFPDSTDHADFVPVRRAALLERPDPAYTFLACIYPFAMRLSMPSSRRFGWQLEANLIFGKVA
jgi:hypothetical protein